MKGAEYKKKYQEEIKDPLNEIIIDGYKYKYKVTKTGLCYRCIFLSTCTLTILILFSEYIKYINSKDKKEKI